MLKFGCLQDSIWDLIQSQWDFFKKTPYVLVTSIDSSMNMRSTRTVIKIVESEDYCSFLGNSLLVSDNKIIEVAQRYNLFSHFDEIWLFVDRPIVDKPEEISIVTATLDFSNEAPQKELVEWFNVTGCILGLGDGSGMNYITTSEEIVQSLYKHQKEFESNAYN